jgi:hypothetical protein
MDLGLMVCGGLTCLLLQEKMSDLEAKMARSKGYMLMNLVCY